MPNRFIKETILSSRKINRLSPPAETLFFRLVVVADDYGRFDAEPSVVLGRCMPLRVGHPKWSVRVIAGLMGELASGSDPLIVIYLVGDRRCGFFPNWKIHQGKPRANASKYPDPTPDSLCIADATQTHSNCSSLSSFDSRLSNSHADSTSDARERTSGIASNPILTPLADLWNRTCPTLPPVSKAGKGRRDKERVRLTERGLEAWQPVFAKLEASGFCHGQNDRRWIATFDWIIKNEDNAIKTLEGKYDDRPINGSTGGPLRGLAAFEAREKARQERGE